MCRHWMNGSCRYGGKCSFLHRNAPGAAAGIEDGSNDQEDQRAKAASQGRGTAKKGPCRPQAQTSHDGFASRTREPHRLVTHIFLDNPYLDSALTAMLIGQGGTNLRAIHEATFAKIRIRGIGSGHLEGVEKKEANVPLMVVITTPRSSQEMFRAAVERTLALLIRLDVGFRIGRPDQFAEEILRHGELYRQIWSISQGPAEGPAEKKTWRAFHQGGHEGLHERPRHQPFPVSPRGRYSRNRRSEDLLLRQASAPTRSYNGGTHHPYSEAKPKPNWLCSFLSSSLLDVPFVSPCPLLPSPSK